jgi:Cell wall-active antibiotics response 4TMS YvqF/Domain of unknown function (DUF5668)
MTRRQTRGGGSGFPITPQLIFGLIVIFVGVVFTLDELGIAPSGSYLRYWPSALIAVGVAKLLHAREGGGAFAGLLFMLAGVWLQGEELNIIHVRLQDIWPLGLVVLGGYLVWSALTSKPRASAGTTTSSDPFAPLPPLDDFRSSLLPSSSTDPSENVDARGAAERAEGPAGRPGHRSGDAHGRATDGDSMMSAVAIFGAVTRGNNSSSFRGANLVAVMGGLEIDLRNAAIDGEAIIDMFAMWGGIEIRVPDDWTVSSQIVPLMGGVEDKTRPPRGAVTHRLTLRGMAFMGGIEIKN